MNHPNEVANNIRKMARLYKAEATDPTVKWDHENIPKVWDRIVRVLERTASECELVCKRYLEPDLTLTDKQFTLLSRAIGARKDGPTRAARLVLVNGIQQSDAASETGMTQQGVYHAIERYRKAWLTMSGVKIPEAYEGAEP
jgi:hypothetical protein